METRTEKAVKNSFWGLISKISGLLLGLFSRTVFIRYLGETYLGVNGVYGELLNMLSLTQLGFGTALNFALYKPVADNDEIKIKKLLHFYKVVYRIIAVVVTCIGLALIPFLPSILQGTETIDAIQLRIYFVIFLSNTVIGYFISYKFAYLNALQKNYISTNVETITHFFTIIGQIVILICTRNFLAYLLFQTAMGIFTRFGIAFYLNKKFPIVKGNTQERLSKEEKKPIFKEVKGLMIHQFANFAVHSTDNLIIAMTSGLGVVMVGLISNYNLIITSVLGFASLLFTGVTSGFGNLVATSSTEHYEKTFREVNFLNVWVYGFCSIAFFVLIPPFIQLWLGEKFLIDDISFLLIVVNQYMLGQSSIYNNVRVGKGNFKKDQWNSLIQAVVNLLVSIIAVRYLGLVGVYIGTIVSRLCTTIIRPWMTYKYLFNKSCSHYYKMYLGYFLFIALIGAITYFVCHFILINVTIWTFIIAIMVVALLPNLLIVVVFYKTESFKSLWKRVKITLNRCLKRG